VSDDAFKIKALQGLDPITPTIGGLLPFRPMRWSPVGALFRAQDTITATSRRVVARWSIGGASDWQAPEGTAADIALGSVVSPGADWRSLGSLSTRVTPGCELRAYALVSPAGITQDGAPTHPTGFYGDIRVQVTWTNGSSSTGPHSKTASTPGSSEPEGDAADEAGANHSNTTIVSLGRHFPPGYTTTPATAAAYSEWTDALIELSIRGNPRVQSIVVYEHPLSHVTAHNNDGLVSVHAMPPGFAALTPGPMTRAPDGPTNEEHRHGTRRMMQVAERQSERLGPRIMHWLAWNEAEADLWEQAEATPVTTTSTTFVHLLDATITTYTNNTPGWLVGSGYAKLARLCDPVLIGRNEIAAVPVRVRVDAERAVANGVVRVQAGAYDWVDVRVTGGRGIYTATGYLQGQVHGDHGSPPLVVWIRSLTGGTLSVYSVSCDFGSW
jgi:hypothetical protein